jgi:predicted transposase YbfD/YdcC
MLDIAGAVVSIDAMGCQKNIAGTIIDAKADYLLALKDNHKNLCEDIRLWLETETAAGRLPIRETVDKGHGRIEIRRYCLSAQIKAAGFAIAAQRLIEENISDSVAVKVHPALSRRINQKKSSMAKI